MSPGALAGAKAPIGAPCLLKSVNIVRSRAVQEPRDSCALKENNKGLSGYQLELNSSQFI